MTCRPMRMMTRGSRFLHCDYMYSGAGALDSTRCDTSGTVSSDTARHLSGVPARFEVSV